MPLMALVNIIVFVLLLFVLKKLSSKEVALSKQVMLGLTIGTLFGFSLQFIYSGSAPDTIVDTIKWTNVLGNSYISLLKMIVMPLILVSMLSAVIQLGNAADFGKIGGSVIGILVLTVSLAAMVAIGVTYVFDLSFEGMLTNPPVELIADRMEKVSQHPGFAELVTSFIPVNIFADLANSRDVSVIAVVIFSILAGIAVLHMKESNSAEAEKFASAINIIQIWVMKLVRLVLAFTPYGVMALMTKVIATSSLKEILNVGWFIVASYTAIIIMFIVHALLLKLIKVNIKQYFSDVWPVLAFAFTSRSSAATIPLNIETQIKKLKIASPIASLSATFGTTIGQNGCAGIYPTMLAIIVASSIPSLGIDPFSISFLSMLVAVVAITSFGVAGIGGGGIFSALIVLPIMGLPVEIIALLISIEPLIDMARTALNVNGAMVTGTIVNHLLKLPTEESKL